MNEIIFLIEESLDGGFEARAIGYPLFTEADNLEGLKKSIRDVIICHFEKEKRPKLIRLHFIKEEVIYL